MKTNKINTSIRWIKRILTTAVAAVLFVIVQGGSTALQGRKVQINLNDESPSGLVLEWQGISNAMYRVEQRTNLVTGTWSTWPPWYAPITGMVSRQIEDKPELSAQFFRVQFPTPEITGGEPAFVPQVGGTTVYVTGNYFYEGDQIRVDGVLLTNVVFINHNLLSGELPDLAPGLHDIDVLNRLSGNILKALPNALEVAPSRERTLQGPPERPLAGPASLRGVVLPRDPPTGQSTGKRMHAPRSSGRGLPTGRRMHTLVRSSGNGGHWGDPHENGLALRSPGGGLDDDCDGDGLSDALDPDSDDDGLSDVHLYSGEVRQQSIDLAVPGRGLDFVWGRTYRSRTGTASSQGNSWSHSYDVRCVQNSDGTVEVFDGSGRKDLFRVQSDGTYACPEIFREGTLDAATATFRLTFADTGYWEFCPFDAASPESGKLDRIVDRNGNTMMLNYNDAGQLVKIVDDLGRTHTVAYTSGGQVASVTDSSGRTIAYTYYGVGESDGAAGDLKSVTSPSVTGTSTGNDFPNGKTTTYTYTTNTAAGAGSLLLTVVDARDQTAVTCAYDLDSASPTFARCLSIQRGAEAPTTITYLPQAPAPSNRFAAMRCIVNDPEGNVSEYDFDLRNRCLSLTAFTGRAEPGQWVTADANRPTDPLRPDDPASFKIIWTWNDGSLCTSETLASGDRTEWVYQGDLDATTPPRFRANLRVKRSVSDDDSDGDGRGDVIVRSFEHDPRFGSERRTGRNPQTGKEIKIAAKKVAKFKAGKALAETVKRLAPGGNGRDDDCDGYDNDCDGFVTSTINPRGFETQRAFDANGNLISSTRVVRDRTPPRMSFAYNPYGQLTTIINALDANDQRRVDTFSYYTSGSQRGYLQQTVLDAGASEHSLATSYEYDARGNVTRCVDPRGTATEIEVNALNQIVAIQTQGATLSEREACRFVYDANNNLVQVDRENRAPDGTLDATNPYWTTALVYDALNRPVQTAQELSQSGAPSIMTNQFVYNANDQLVLHRLPEAVSGADPDNDIAYAYDERGLLFSRVCASGTTLSTGDVCAYDANGNIIKIRRVDADPDADGDTVRESTFAYDGFGRCVQATDAMGNVTTHLYDAGGNRTYTKIEGELVDLPGSTSNRPLSEETFTYDALNRMVGHSVAFFDPDTGVPIDDGVSQTTWTYAPNGQLTAYTDDNGHTTACTYDSVGRLSSIIDPKGNTSSFTYDSNGNLLSEQAADLSDVSAGTQLFTQTFSYDALNRCISATDNVGNTVSNAYDSSHNLVSSTDALGNESVCTVDGLGRVTDTTHYSGAESGGVVISTSQVAYRNNRCVSSTDGNGNTTTFAHDALDRCVTVTHQDGTVEVRGWDPRSNLARYTDANGTTITNTYDLLDRLVQRDIAVAPGVSDTTTFEILAYDGLGQLVSAKNDASALSYAYDSIGNRIRCVQDGMITTSVYDGTGNRLSLTCPDGRTIFTAHDALGLPTSLSTRATAGESPVSLATFAYDGPGRLAKMTHANSINTRVFWNGEQNTPNAADDFGWQQVARVNHAKAGGGKVIDQRNNSYDRNQNQSLRMMTAPWTSGGPLTANSYAYDGLNRLTRGTHSNSPAGDNAQSYVLDANGNRLQVTNNGVTEAYVMDNTIPPGDAQMNQYTEAPSGAFTYDANGNRLSSSNATSQRVYRYDYANRLVQVDELDAAGDLSPLVTYRFSPVAVGRRLGKTIPVFSGGGPDVTGFAPLGNAPFVTTTTYLYAYGIDQNCDGVDDNCDSPTGDDLLQTYVDGVLQRTFVAPDRFAASGATASIRDGVALFHHYSDQGSLLALTDSKGDVVERFDYDDYGAPLFLDDGGNSRTDATAPLTDVRQLFQGMVWNEETGLYGGGGGGGGPSTQMNKGELIDAIAKDAGLSMYDPLIGRNLSRPYGDNARYSSPWARGPLIDRTSSVLVPDLPRKGDTYAQKRRDGRPPELVRTVTASGGIGQDRRRGQDYNGTRSNRCSSGLVGDGSRGGGAGKATYGIAAKKVAKFKAGKALAETVK